MGIEFPRGAIVHHIVTRNTYKIVCSAEHCRIAADDTPAYAYQGTGEDDNIVYVREKYSMEERFALIGEQGNG